MASRWSQRKKEMWVFQTVHWTHIDLLWQHAPTAFIHWREAGRCWLVLGYGSSCTFPVPRGFGVKGRWRDENSIMYHKLVLGAVKLGLKWDSDWENENGPGEIGLAGCHSFWAFIYRTVKCIQKIGASKWRMTLFMQMNMMLAYTEGCLI